jgi:hypothetical protein
MAVGTALLIVVALLLASPLLVHAASGTQPAWGIRSAAGLCAVEAMFLALAVPYGICGRQGRRIALAGAFLAMAGLALVVGTWAGAFQTMLWTQVFFLSWAALLWAACALGMRLGLAPDAAQAVITVLALAVLGSPFYANMFIEIMPSAEAKRAVIGVVLWTNPWLVATGSLLQVDPLRTQRLYDFSVMHLYGLKYPCAGIGSVGLRTVILSSCYATVAGGLGVATAVLRRHERARAMSAVADSELRNQ